MGDQLQIGHVVLVPLGKVGETGYIVGFPREPGIDPEKIRPITRLVDPHPAFDERQLDFFEWIAKYYLAPLGSVVHTAVPSQIKAKVVRVLEPTEEGVEALAGGEAEDEPLVVLREVVRRPGMTMRTLAKGVSDDLSTAGAKRVAGALVTRGWLCWGEREIGGVKREVRTVSLMGTREEARDKLSRPGKRMIALVEALAVRGGIADVPMLLAEHGSSAREALNRLAEAGAVRFDVRQSTLALEDVPAQGAVKPPVLNGDQQAALKAITAEDGRRPWLLFGVTGSGKTEVFLGAARHALDAQKQVCVLVPEIGLTPQLVGRFKARFGDDVAVLHSGLTPGDRLAHWRRIRNGEAQVAVGARSALFAPFRDLGLIVVDEEHDDSYKQDEGVKYSARDLAVVLGRRWECPVVLASATPSMETWFNAKQDRYGLLRLPKRATPRPVPTVEIIDMTEVEKGDDGKRPLFSPVTVQAMRETVANGGKVIALFNRRGYATMVQCEDCGGTYECPNCGISMTLHRRSRVISCHYCGLKRAYVDTCPACESPNLGELGKGTERIEETVAGLLPGVPIARMDADTTAVRGSHHTILDAFRKGETKVLVGTQIIAKGHDFPGVHLVVIVNADQGFKMPDFRASERTYALLVQAAGRAGRGDVAGRVIVQTWNTDHYALQELDDVDGFLVREARLRQTLRYPPYHRLVLVRVDGGDRRKASAGAVEVARMLRDSARNVRSVQVLGPSPAALPRLVGRWRFQIIIRSNQMRELRGYLASVRTPLLAASKRGVRVSVDIDPRHLM